MTDQLAIGDDGQIIAQPLTWDGEPIYSQSTVREGLFPTEAFEQMPGQIGIEDDLPEYRRIDGTFGSFEDKQ